MSGKEWMRSGLINWSFLFSRWWLPRAVEIVKCRAPLGFPASLATPLPKTLSSFRISERRASGN